MSDDTTARRVAERFLKKRLKKQLTPFEYRRPHVPEPKLREHPRVAPEEAVLSVFKSLPWWGGLKKDAPDPERAEEEYAEEATFDSPEYSPGGRGYKGQFKAFREKYDEVKLPNPMPKNSYFGWQPKVTVSTLISWTDGEGSEDPAVAHRMQALGARIVRSMYRTFRRSQTTR
jgi:hypothetical protein